MTSAIQFGCIADDFTGASDAASFLVKGGLKTILLNGIPETEPDFDAEAVVIALKTRTQETASAVADTEAAAAWLTGHGARQLFIKYCSTFDSTPQGNIGPIADRMLEICQTPYTILCPALPVNGRTVVNGNLYVYGIPLHESHMKNHPLTPMWASDLAELMRPQSKYPCLKLDSQALRRPDAEIRRLLEEFAAAQEHFYVIPDYAEEEDAARIMELFGQLPLLTGGSGLMERIGRRLSASDSGPDIQAPASSHTEGKGLLLAGSCSKATLAQIAYFQNHGGLSFKMDPLKLLAGEQTIEDLWSFFLSHPEDTILIYSSDEADQVKKVQETGRETIAALLESTTAELARRAVAYGYTRIIVAGGETSGAVTQGLGFSDYQICESVAPGVPVMIPLNHPEIRLVLKSGNFGQEDFFERALAMTGK